MSKAIGPGRIGSVRRFIKILSELVATLPSTEEKQKIFDSLVALTNYLQSAKQNLAQIPTRDDMQQLTIVLEQFERLITRAEDNPLISKALGVEKKNKKKKVHAVTQTSERIKIFCNELDKLTIDQIRETLSNDPKYTSNDLRELAINLDIRVTARISRDTLVNQIIVRIANDRGYKTLGGFESKNDPSNNN